MEPHIICAYFRIGNNGKCVDNFNSGGMVAPVDEKTGTVTQLAIDKQKNVYEKHPQTGETIKGFKFPYWNEAIEFCKKHAKKYLKWVMLVGMLHLHQKDLYLLKQMNFHGHDIYQLPVHTPEKIGMMPKFNFEK